MAGRKRKVKITLPGMQGRVLVEADVADPYAPERRERVKRAIYDNTIEAMASRGHLRAPGEAQDGTEARLIAAAKFLALYARAGGSGARAIDYSAIKVDVSSRYDGTPEGQAMALREMARIREAIGAEPYKLLHSVICNDTAVTLLIRAERKRVENASVEFYQRVRSALDGVIQYYGVATGNKSRGIIAYAEI